MMILIVLVLLCSFTITCSFWFLSQKICHSKPTEIPPGPRPLPLIGNILQFGQSPHKILANLSKQYGPVISIKLGISTFVVISSPEIAKQTLTKFDNVLSVRRPVPVAAQAHGHDKISVAFLPVGTRWKKLRRICKEHIFSPVMLDACRGLREEKLQQLHDHVEQCRVHHQVVNIEEAAFVTALNLMSNTLFSADFAAYEGSQELKRTVQGVITSISAPNLSDCFPFLEMFDPQGIKRTADFYVGKLLAMFERIIKERLKSREGCNYSMKSDLLETLLDLSQRNGSDLSQSEIKHLLLDLFLGGTDTTSNTVDWAMTELLLNPKKLSCLRQEINSTVPNNGTVKESDISRMPYLQAVIKEVFRYHPPAPFLIPHKAEVDIELKGYKISRNTRVIINAWAIGRDPRVWLNPASFEPERFLDSEIDVKGQDFELTPFGSGRRICPGMPLAHRMIHLMVATLVHNFDWEAVELDTEEKFGLSLRRVSPLRALPVKLSYD